MKISKSAVHYRVKKLERSGVIEGYHAKLNAEKIGKGYEAITLIRAKFSPNYHEKLGERLASLPGVWAVYFTFGESDFIILTRGVDREDLLSSIENLTKYPWNRQDDFTTCSEDDQRGHDPRFLGRGVVQKVCQYSFNA